MTDLVKVIEDPKTVEQFKLALPQHLSADRFKRIAITEIRKNPDIMKCTAVSVLSCLIQSAQLGLEPGNGLGHAYLIPFRNKQTGTHECTLIVGYKGLLSLARRSGEIKRISATCVYKGDKFLHIQGSKEWIEHERGPEEAAAAVTHVYAVAEFKDGALQHEVMTRKQIDAIKNRGRQNPVWNSDFCEMARKTAIRRIAKYLPLSPEMADAIRADGESDLELPEQNNPAKYHDVIETDAIESAREENDKDRKIVVAEFSNAWKKAEENGSNPDILVGMPYQTALGASTEVLEALTAKIGDRK